MAGELTDLQMENKMSFFMFRIFFIFVVLAGLSPLRAQEAQEKVDIKKKQLFEIKYGQLWAVDFYNFPPVQVNGASKLNFVIRQERSIANTQDCGKLTDRSIQIKTGSGSDLIRIDSPAYDEFVAAKDYFKSFEDAWDTLDKDKSKILIYDFGAPAASQKNSQPQYAGRLSLEGDRENLTFSIRYMPNNSQMFSTSDIKVIGQFNLLVNDVQKFLKSHRFEECL
jgi:hypothetical protein